MEIKYRVHWYIRLITWLSPIGFLILQMDERPIYNYIFHDVYTWFFLSLSVFFGIISETGYCAVNDKGLRDYSFFENKYIGYDEIECVVLLPAHKFIGISVEVGIFAKGKKITIISWTKDYKEILKRVVTEARKREIEGIDREVVALLKR